MPENESLEVSNSGRKLIKEWDAARRHHNDMKDKAEEANHSLDDRILALAQWVGIKAGEKILLPVGEGFIEIASDKDMMADISWRSFPKRGI